jgi:GNAT superfamily N-acetyltransferase
VSDSDAPAATGPQAVRPARPDDVGDILALVVELADYERSAEHATMTAAQLHPALFGDDPAASCLVATVGDEVVGFALWFSTFSTWTGERGVHLEDLFVRPAARGRGLGKQLLQRVAGVAREGGCARMEWSVLDWNAPAIGFYASLGARPMTEWTTYRLDGDDLVANALTG